MDNNIKRVGPGGIPPKANPPRNPKENQASRLTSKDVFTPSSKEPVNVTKLPPATRPQAPSGAETVEAPSRAEINEVLGTGFLPGVVQLRDLKRLERLRDNPEEAYFGGTTVY